MTTPTRWLPTVLFAALVSGCGSTTTPTDAGSDAPADVAQDTRPDIAADVQFACPMGSLDPVFSQPCAGFEGAQCRYGYTVPGCGGRTQTCVGGRWEEVHTDPSPQCFDAATDVVDATAPDGTPGDVVPDAPAEAAVDAGNPCRAVGGICLGRGADCAGGGGEVAPAGAAGCRFSDGDGVCCVPPAAQPMGDTCATHGGLCAPIAGCNFVGGSFAPPSCTGVGIVCCVPPTACGPETQVCCAEGGSATFRPSCDRGSYRCTIAGTSLMPRDRCP